VTEHECPQKVAEYAAQAAGYVERAVGVPLSYDSETLPLLDHYLTSVPVEQPETLALIAATSGAYFGEVVRRHLGGRWEATAADPLSWRVILPTALSLTPGQMVLAAIARADIDGDAEVGVPSVLERLISDALAAMGEVSEDVYYSLCGRLDTLEHLHELVTAYAAQKLAEKAADADDDDDDEPEAAKN
jgi:hypothetical protein